MVSRNGAAASGAPRRTCPSISQADALYHVRDWGRKQEGRRWIDLWEWEERRFGVPSPDSRRRGTKERRSERRMNGVKEDSSAQFRGSKGSTTYDQSRSTGVDEAMKGNAESDG